MSYSKSLYSLSSNIVKLLRTQKALYFIGLAVILDAIFNFYDSFCINFIIQSIRPLKVISFSSKILSKESIFIGILNILIFGAIFDAILNFSNCSRMTRCHQLVSLCRRSHLSKYVKTFSMHRKSRTTRNSPNICRTKNLTYLEKLRPFLIGNDSLIRC